MGRLLTSGQVGEIGLRRMKQIRESAQKKWDSLGFLEGLRGHLSEDETRLYRQNSNTTRILTNHCLEIGLGEPQFCILQPNKHYLGMVELKGFKKHKL